MIYLCAAEEGYRNDIGEVIRLFTGMDEIAWTGGEEPQMSEGDSLVKCALRSEGAFAEYVVYERGRYCAEEPLEGVGNSSFLIKKKLEKRSLKRAVFCAMRQAFSNQDCELPWGCLTGIRPTVLARELIETHGREEAKTMLSEVFAVRQDKIDLVMDILDIQEPFIAGDQSRYNLYIGVPFCKTRCVYCSFAAAALGARGAKADDVENYVRALTAEISENAAFMADAGYRAASIYIGGGTPTALSVSQLERVIVRALDSVVDKTAGFEFTVEAGRPDTIGKEMLEMIKGCGVNRISINPQTMNDSTLAAIGRGHSSGEVIEAFELAHSIGFDVINMDLIAGLPGEDIAMFERTLREIEKLSPENLTVHTLAIKRASALKGSLGEYPLPGGQEVSLMIDASKECAARMGMRPYYMYRQKHMTGNLENVGYCKEGAASRYNIDIMEETGNILALGAGAISKRVFPASLSAQRRIERLPNPKDIATYMQKTEEMTKKRRILFCLQQPAL